jgi:hypothetical protein
LGAVLKLAEPNPGKSQPFTAGVPEGLADQYRITATGTYANYYTNVFQSFIGYSVTVPDGRTGTILDTNRTISSNQVTFYSHLISLAGGAPGAGNYFVGQRNLLSLSSFYAGGANVPSGTVGFPNGVSTPIPSSGTISYANFLGAARQTAFTAQTIGITDLTLTAGTWYVYARAVGGGGGGGGGDGVFGSPGGFGSSWRAKFTINAAQPGNLTLVAGNAGAGGGPNGSQKSRGGRSLSFTETGTRDGNGYTWYPVHQPWAGVGGAPPTWTPLLGQESIWMDNFTVSDTNRIPISVFFPTTGDYTFTGAAAENFNVYLGSETSLVGNFSGSSSSKVVVVNVQAGWRTVFFNAYNAFGTVAKQAIALVINRTSDNVQIFNTRGLTDGGYTSGGYWFLNGGSGGFRGTTGTSGSGGGGGGGTALLWYPNNNPRTAEPIVLGIAGGGGGGAGTGSQVNPNLQSNSLPPGPEIIYLANWNIRGLVLGPTGSSSIFSPAVAGGNSATWFGRAVGNRVPYVVSNGKAGLRGHGGHFDLYGQQFFPPYPSIFGATGQGLWDGGAGGGGGAPWGYAGGYAERPDSSWVNMGLFGALDSWNAPNESAGSGGGQGFLFLNSNYVGTGDYFASSGNGLQYNTGSGTFNGTRGSGGPSSGSTTNVGIGTGGSIAVRISNVDDGIYPAGSDPLLAIQGSTGPVYYERNTSQDDVGVKLVIGSNGSIGMFSAVSDSLTTSTPDSSITNVVQPYGPDPSFPAVNIGVENLPTAWCTPLAVDVGIYFEVSYSGSFEVGSTGDILRLFGESFTDNTGSITTPWYALSTDRTITMLATGSTAGAGVSAIGAQTIPSLSNNGTISIRRIGTTSPVASFTIALILASKEGD